MILKINDRIRTRKLQYFSDFNVYMKYDAVGSSFSFSFYFDPDNQEHVDLACIGHYHICTVEHNGELILTGTVLSEAFTDGPKTELVHIGGYSLPGVLEDCEIPVGAGYQSDLLSLNDIAQKYLPYFGLSYAVDSQVSDKMNEPFDSTTANEGQSVKSYFSELASQKNIIVSHNAKGQVLFTGLVPRKKPVAEFTGGVPGTTMKLDFNGQAMHSKIWVVSQTDVEDANATENSVTNPYVLSRVFREKVSVMNSGKEIDALQAAKNIRSQELKNLKLTIDTDRWDIDGKIIRPGMIISVQNPRIYLKKKSNWFVDEVHLMGSSDKMVATLTCVPPSVYDGTEPEYLFAGINLH